MLFNRILAVLVAVLGVLQAGAINWDTVTGSGEYYFAEGRGATEAEAEENAKVLITNQIVSHVSTSFEFNNDEKTSKGKTERESMVRMRVNTYSSTTLTNLTRMDAQGKAPNLMVRMYIHKSEVEKAFEARKKKVLAMVKTAGVFRNNLNLDMALQYYYRAYALLRTLPNPGDLTDGNGVMLNVSLKAIIEDIMNKVNVEFAGREDTRVELKFTYQGKPVSSLEFKYNDGRSECEGVAKDGHGMIEMTKGYTTDVYHLSINYKGMSDDSGDAELMGALSIMPEVAFAHADLQVRDSGKKKEVVAPVKNTAPALPSMPVANVDAKTKSKTPSFAACAATVETVVNAFIRRNSMAADTCFTTEGFKRYNNLLRYGKAQVVGSPQLRYFKTQEGYVVVRGLRMSFTFKGRVKKTFVEDVVFTLDSLAKIDNVTFGLGQVAQDGILEKDAPGWNDSMREMLLEFMENYKTAYCMKDSVYIRNIFADDAVIIVGRVLSRKQFVDPEKGMSEHGKQVIRYNRLSKDQYLKNLRKTFDANEFINLRFTHNDIQWLEKYAKENMFAIQIGQEYRSSSYSDKGFLFLIVDMKDPEAPMIKVRTWQPNEEDITKLYNAGDFWED